jgi:hypothetical protein
MKEAANLGGPFLVLLDLRLLLLLLLGDVLS